MLIPQSLRYTEDHLWLRRIGVCDSYVGITDFAQKEIGNIDLIEIESSNVIIQKGQTWGRIYGTNRTFDLKAPCDCQISAIAATIDKESARINNDPYYYWLATVTFNHSLNRFLSNQQYIALIQ